ncbi:MAG: HD domain-containing protein [Deltaproteobacteria bacterium]|nr:HD domain-containing protein [Deltaproteobacteria bacterium]
MKMKTVFVRDIKAGEKVSDAFLVAEKNLAYSQKGSPYLNVRLRDRTGEIEGKIWENALEWDRIFKKGDIVTVQSKAANFKNTIQLSIVDVMKLEDYEVDITDYLPAAKENIDEMFSSLMSFIDKIDTPCLKSLLESFFSDQEVTALFKRAPAAKGFHHVYLGGLLEHTLSVTRLLEWVAGHYQGINRDLLITGGILHDIGKIYEFSYHRVFDYSDEGRLVGHIIMGVEMLDKKIAAVENFPEKLAVELRHLILSHHGSQEFGSPKRPKTLEAQIVHSVDDLDAKVNAFQSFIEESGDDESKWTPFHKLLERFIYKG